jgi:hypothetical protein
MMKHTLRYHGFGETHLSIPSWETHVAWLPAKTAPAHKGGTAEIVAGFVARLANIDILAAPRFAPSPISARPARAFHHVPDSMLQERKNPASLRGPGWKKLGVFSL